MEESYKFFQNKSCKYFPCHENVEESEFNCLFCYCPLYMLQEKCGGNYTYKNGIKICTHCVIPHNPRGYKIINEKLKKYIKEHAKGREL